MKKWVVALLCLCHFSYADPIQEREIDVSQLVQAFGISSDIVQETQKRWLRKSDQERWELSEIDQSSLVLSWAKESGLFDAWKPARDIYDKALILGATTPKMQKRLEYLKSLWLQGIRFDEIVWLTGDRPLDARVDSLIDRCHNESEAASILWRETDLPDEMRKLPVVFVAVPMKASKRPDTRDTLMAWLEIAKDPCTALFVSDQPYCGYQFAVIKSTLPNSYFFDVVGPSGEAPAAVILDTLARWIYQNHALTHPGKLVCGAHECIKDPGLRCSVTCISDDFECSFWPRAM